MFSILSRPMAVLISFLISGSSLKAQPVKKENKPYRVLTSGRQITLKSTQNIRDIMIWTTNGDRVVEQKEIRDRTLTVELPVYRKAFFLMVVMENGKVHTEKIGIP